MASLRQAPQHSVADLALGLPTPLDSTHSTAATIDIDTSLLSTGFPGGPVLIEQAARQYGPAGYAQSSFQKVHEDTQELLGLIQQTRAGRHGSGSKHRAGELPSDRDLAALTSTAQGLVNQLQSIRNHRHKTQLRRTKTQRSHASSSQATCASAVPSHSPCDDCNRTKTPEWRAGPSGPEALCNVCGLLYAKRMTRMQRPK